MAVQKRYQKKFVQKGLLNDPQDVSDDNYSIYYHFTQVTSSEDLDTSISIYLSLSLSSLPLSLSLSLSLTLSLYHDNLAEAILTY